MNILIISPVASHPTDQGNRNRVNFIGYELKKLNAKIHFAYFPREWGGKYDISSINEMQNFYDYFDIIVPEKKISYTTNKNFLG